MTLDDWVGFVSLFRAIKWNRADAGGRWWSSRMAERIRETF